MRSSIHKDDNNPIISRMPNLIYNLVDNEVVILSLNNEEYYSLNQVGSTIWGIIKEPRTLSNIIEKLVEQYEVPYDQCKMETIEYLNELNNLGVVKLTNE